MAESSTGRLYNPYEGLSSASRLDPVWLDAHYRMPSTAEYVFTEEASRARRSWSDNMAFYTASGWVLGGVTGALYGIREGSMVPAGLVLDTTRLKVRMWV